MHALRANAKFMLHLFRLPSAAASPPLCLSVSMWLCLHRICMDVVLWGRGGGGGRCAASGVRHFLPVVSF